MACAFIDTSIIIERTPKCMQDAYRDDRILFINTRDTVYTPEDASCPEVRLCGISSTGNEGRLTFFGKS